MNLNLEDKNKPAIQEIDKKIDIKYVKLKNKAKTRIYGITNYIEEKDIDNLIKHIKKKLGCGGVYTDDESNIKNIEFQGNHRESIKEILIENFSNIPADKIFLKGA